MSRILHPVLMNKTNANKQMHMWAVSHRSGVGAVRWLTPRLVGLQERRRANTASTYITPPLVVLMCGCCQRCRPGFVTPRPGSWRILMASPPRRGGVSRIPTWRDWSELSVRGVAKTMFAHGRKFTLFAIRGEESFDVWPFSRPPPFQKFSPRTSESHGGKFDSSLSPPLCSSVFFFFCVFF